MRRSLASQYRVKTAHHLLNILALNREIDTYNVNGLLKAASVGQSKEACLRYAGLHAALLIEKRAIDFNNLFKAADDETPIPRGGYNSTYFNPTSGVNPERPMINKIPTSSGPGFFSRLGTGIANTYDNATTGIANGMIGAINTGSNAATGAKNLVKNTGTGIANAYDGATTGIANAGIAGLNAGSAAVTGAKNLVKNTGTGIANAYDKTTTGIADGMIGAGNMASNAATGIGNAAKRGLNEVASLGQGNIPYVGAPMQSPGVPPTQPLTASVIPKPAAPAPEEGSNGVPLQSYADNERVPSNFGAASPVAKAKPQRAAKPSYTEDPVEAAYSKKLNQGAAQSAGRQQATNIASGVGNFMSNAGRTAANAVNGASKAMGRATPPSTGGYAASQSAYGASPAAAPAPAQSDYDSQIGESQRYSDASKQQGDEDAYMKSIEPTAPTYRASPPAEPAPAAQEEVAQESQPQAPQGRQFRPVKNILGRIRGNK